MKNLMIGMICLLGCISSAQAAQSTKIASSVNSIQCSKANKNLAYAMTRNLEGGFTLTRFSPDYVNLAYLDENGTTLSGNSFDGKHEYVFDASTNSLSVDGKTVAEHMVCFAQGE